MGYSRGAVFGCADDSGHALHGRVDVPGASEVCENNPTPIVQ